MWRISNLFLTIHYFMTFGVEQRTRAVGTPDGVSLECQSHNMTLYVNKTSMSENDTISLLNNTCMGLDNQTHFIVTTNYQDCGTSHMTTVSNVIIFKNTATIERYVPSDEVVMRDKHANKIIEMRCTFPSFIITRSGEILLEGNGYSPWSEYGVCSSLCGGGNQTSTRDCLMSSPSNCIGSKVRTRKCNTIPCPRSCNTLECTKEFTECMESFNSTLPATCVCKTGFVEVGEKCKTSEKIVEVVFFKLNITFKSEYEDFKNPVTVILKTRIEKDLHRTLNLSTDEYVVITNITQGSVVIDFLVLLKLNSTDNKLTIERKLSSEVKTKKTGHLNEYFPVSSQAIIVLDTDLCILESDSCNRTNSICEATPGIGLNFGCSCKHGYVQENRYTCSEPKEIVPRTKSDNDLRLILIINLIGLFVLLFFVCCFLMVRRRRQRECNEQGEDIVDDGMMVYNDSIFQGPARFSRKMRAYSMYRDNPKVEVTNYRDIPE